MLYEVLHEGWLHELCSIHDDDEVKVKDLRLHESDNEVLQYRYT